MLSQFEARELLSLRPPAKTPTDSVVHGSFSVDLGTRTLDSVLVQPDGISIPEHLPRETTIATWSDLRRMSKRGRFGAYECFLDGSTPAKISGFSETTHIPATLMPCVPDKPPTILLGGFGMHRFSKSDPAADTQTKIEAVGLPHLHGSVLDVCTGLGYTAIAAADVDTVTSVTTIELDPLVISLQRRNPWSARLFTHSKIDRRQGDAIHVLDQLPQHAFQVIIHDPPTMALGGDLYSAQFYAQLRRACAPRGRLFHYIGNPDSRESGTLFAGVIRRLRDEGFEDVEVNPASFGVTAYAP